MYFLPSELRQIRSHCLAANNKRKMMIWTIWIVGIKGFLRVEEFNDWRYQYGPGWRDKEVSSEEIYRQMFIPLICRSLNVSSQADAQQLSLPREKVRLFYFTELPAELAVDNPYLGKQGGYALHVVDIPLEQTKGG